MSFFFFLMIRRPPRSTLFPTRRSSDLAQAARRVRGARGAGWLGAPPPPRKPPRPLTSRARRPGEAAAGALQRRAAPARPLRRSLVAPAAHADRGAARGGGRDRRHAPRRARADPRGHGFGQDARLP